MESLDRHTWFQRKLLLLLLGSSPGSPSTAGSCCYGVLRQLLALMRTAGCFHRLCLDPIGVMLMVLVRLAGIQQLWFVSCFGRPVPKKWRANKKLPIAALVRALVETPRLFQLTIT
jgi:hypothetical protein